MPDLGKQTRTIATQITNGTPVIIRQVQPHDKALIKIGMAHLSPKSRHFRFFSGIKELPPALLSKLTEIDHINHDAWGAIDPSHGDARPAGVARYIRLPDNSRAAEPAVTVIDEYQGNGLGTLLLGVVASRAIENDIHTFEAHVLANNKRMLEICRELGATSKYLGDGELLVTIPLTENPNQYPKTPAGDVFRTAAALMN